MARLRYEVKAKSKVNPFCFKSSPAAAASTSVAHQYDSVLVTNGSVSEPSASHGHLGLPSSSEGTRQAKGIAKHFYKNSISINQ
jgi:hypothetical protein